MAEDEETQLHGGINITQFSLNDSTNTFDRRAQSLIRKPYDEWDQEEKEVYQSFSHNKINEKEIYLKLAEASPIRYTAVHICMPDQRIYRFFKAIVLSMMPSNVRACTRFHTGSHLECNYVLCQFGISMDDIPSSITGTVKSKSLFKFIKARMEIDEFRKTRAKAFGVNYVSHEMEQQIIRMNMMGSSRMITTTTRQYDVDDQQPPPPSTAANKISPVPSLVSLSLLPTTIASNMTAGLSASPPPSTPAPSTATTTTINGSSIYSLPGTDCPERYCVVFGDRSTYKSRANAEFRDYLKMKQHTRSLLVSSLPLSSLPSKSILLDAHCLDSIIDDVTVPPAGTAAAEVTAAAAVTANNDDDTTDGDCNTKMNNGKQYFKFASFDKEVGWYVYLNPYTYYNNSTPTVVTSTGISTSSNNPDKKKEKKKLINKDRIELRKKISQMIRDERKRTLKKHNTAIPQQQQQQQQQLQSQQQSSVLGQSSDIPLEVSSNSNISNNINGHRSRNSNELVGDITSDFFGLIGGDSTTMGIDIDKSSHNKRRKKNNSCIFNCDNSVDNGDSAHSGSGVYDATNNNNNDFVGRGI